MVGPTLGSNNNPDKQHKPRAIVLDVIEAIENVYKLIQTLVRDAQKKDPNTDFGTTWDQQTSIAVKAARKFAESKNLPGHEIELFCLIARAIAVGGHEGLGSEGSPAQRAVDALKQANVFAPLKKSWPEAAEAVYTVLLDRSVEPMIEVCPNPRPYEFPEVLAAMHEALHAHRDMGALRTPPSTQRY